MWERCGAWRWGDAASLLGASISSMEPPAYCPGGAGLRSMSYHSMCLGAKKTDGFDFLSLK